MEVRLLRTLWPFTQCSSDLRPSNILLKLQYLDGLDEEQVIEILGEPEIATVVISKSVPSTTTLPHVPKHLIYPIDYDTIDPSLISTEAYIADLHVNDLYRCSLRQIVTMSRLEAYSAIKHNTWGL